MIKELNSVFEKHKNDFVQTFQINIAAMCADIIQKLEQLKHFEDLDEQGLLLKLPCKIGDTVYFISERAEKKGRRKIITEFIENGIVDNITLGDTMIPQVTVCDDKNTWITFDNIENFGKTVFLTQAEAKEALKRLEVAE